MSHAKANMHRRSFLKSMSALIAVSGQPGVFQFLRTAETGQSDTTRILVGPDNSRSTVLARPQDWHHYYQRAQIWRKGLYPIFHSLTETGDSSRDRIREGAASFSNTGPRTTS
jgi:hypothetical protein